MAGHVGRGVQILMQEDVDYPAGVQSQAIFEKLKALHPPAEREPLPHLDVHSQTLIVQPADILKCAKAMAKGEAPGPSGLASDVLWQALEEEQRQKHCVLLDRVTEAVHKILTNETSAATKAAVTAIRLVAVPKRKGGGASRCDVRSDSETRGTYRPGTMRRPGKRMEAPVWS